MTGSHVSWGNNNTRAAHISSLITCNSHVSPNIMVGSDDGCVRVWSQELVNIKQNINLM